jgi:hypothetical protein
LLESQALFDAMKDRSSFLCGNRVVITATHQCKKPRSFYEDPDLKHRERMRELGGKEAIQVYL